MRTTNENPMLERMIGSLGDCLNRESAKRLIDFKVDKSLQAHMQKLAEKNNQGKLTEDERTEYSKYVTLGTFVAILKSRARQLLGEETIR